ncbi:MAG: pyrroloquinoline quinone biosynthesis protein PqqB [Pseudomonadota bacterium]
MALRSAMRILILGAAAGGGLPQWNCGCRNCVDARAGRIPSLSQSSIAVSADGARWLVLNASPDIRAQLAAAPALAPAGLRGTPIEAVMLTNGDVDHIAGLLTLREKTPFALYATPEILGALADNPIFGVMDPALVDRCAVQLGAPTSIAAVSVETFAVPGQVPLYLEEGEDVVTDQIGETTIGLMISDGAKTLAYAPGCAAAPDDLLARLFAADMVLFDGTVWENEEMPRLGAGKKTGARMGHMSMTGPNGSLARLANLPGRRMYIHINNTNPVLQPESEERRAVEAAGWTVAADGMEIDL